MLGREYKGESRALSILEVLDECLNYDELQAQIVHPLKGLKVVTSDKPIIAVIVAPSDVF